MACPFHRRTASLEKCVNGGQPHAIGNACLDGYARGHCAFFPSNNDDAPDAIEITAASQTADTVLIRYSIERNYLPVSVGENVFNWRTRQWRLAMDDEMIAAHMEAYLTEFETLKTGASE